MWLAVKNLTAADRNVGVDIHLFFTASVPDAWRFDDAGCQTSSRVTTNNLADTKSCPAMLGSNPLAITNLTYETAAHRENFRLAYVYDPFTPAPGVIYTMWNIVFDHTHSVSGTDGDGSTCDNAGLPMTISMSDPSDVVNESFILTAQGVDEPFHFADPKDQFVTWNGEQPVAAAPATWDRIKSDYR